MSLFLWVRTCCQPCPLPSACGTVPSGAKCPHQVESLPEGVWMQPELHCRARAVWLMAAMPWSSSAARVCSASPPPVPGLPRAALLSTLGSSSTTGVTVSGAAGERLAQPGQGANPSSKEKVFK